MDNPYIKFVQGYENLIKEATTYRLGGIEKSTNQTDLSDQAPNALIFAPHPDDECIIGALALRLSRETGTRIVNVAVTQGSNKARQAGRLEELKGACNYLGFEVRQTKPNGLEKVNPKTYEADPKLWAESVKCLASILEEYRPRCIFFPHAGDLNSTHIGTNLLVMDALKEQGSAFETLLVETEFWAAMTNPNLMIESSAKDVADLVAAISFHVDEVRRNPYHLRLPAWLQDNVRRGGELVGGQGGAAPDFCFATLYRLSRWTKGGQVSVLGLGKFVSSTEPLSFI